MSASQSRITTALDPEVLRETVYRELAYLTTDRAPHMNRWWYSDRIKDVVMNLLGSPPCEPIPAAPPVSDTTACVGHDPKQHRDMKPPWCHVCGRDAGGRLIGKAHPRDPDRAAPSGTEWAVRYPDGHVLPFASEERARQDHAYGFTPGKKVLLCRTVTDWVEPAALGLTVTDETGAEK